MPGDKAAALNVFDLDWWLAHGAELFGKAQAAACRIVSAGDIEPLDWGEVFEQPTIGRGPGGRTWHRFAWLADGGWLAINLDPSRIDPRPNGDDNRSYDRGFNAICFGRLDSQGQPGRNPVVALSFTELLERILDQGRTPYWLDPQFTDYGDAELYTCRG